MQAAFEAVADARKVQFEQQPPAEFAEIPHEDFMQHMQAMQQYYKSGPATPMGPMAPYPLPIALIHPPILLHPPVTPGSTTHPATPVLAPKGVTITLASSKAVDDVLLQSHKETIAFIHSHAEGMIAAAESLSKTHDTAKFTSQMNALRAKSKADHNARIDALYNRFTQLSKVHPDQRAHMLHATNHIGAFFGGLWASGEGVAHKVMSAAAGAAKTAVEHVGQWASNAVHDVGSVIKSLF